MDIQVAEAQAARRAERETLTTDSRMRGRPKGPEETKSKPKAMGPPKELSEEEKARRQERQVRRGVSTGEDVLPMGQAVWSATDGKQCALRVFLDTSKCFGG